MNWDRDDSRSRRWTTGLERLSEDSLSPRRAERAARSRRCRHARRFSQARAAHDGATLQTDRKCRPARIDLAIQLPASARGALRLPELQHKYKGAESEAVVSGLAAETEFFKLPQTIHLASCAAFISDMRQICEEEHCLVAHTFEEGNLLRRAGSDLARRRHRSRSSKWTSRSRVPGAIGSRAWPSGSASVVFRSG